MVYNYTLYERPRRPGYYSYAIINNGNVETIQVFKPGEEGTVDMTQAIASSIAGAIVNLKNNPPPALFTIAVTPTPTAADKLKVKTYIESLGYTIKVLS